MKKVEYHPKQVRLFLILLLAFMALVTLRLIPRAALTRRLIVIGAEAAAVLFFLFLPRLFFPLFRLIMTGSGYLGNFMFGLISLLVFYLILTPISLVQRLSGKRFMEVPTDPARDSYYDEPDEPHKYEKQF